MKIHGFKYLNLEGLLAVFKDIDNRGTCELAYENLADTHIALLLNTPELQAIRKIAHTPAWARLDNEIIESLIMLYTMRNLGTTVLAWCCLCKTINTNGRLCNCADYEDEDQPRFLLDFTEELPTTIYKQLRDLQPGTVLQFPATETVQIRNCLNSINFKHKSRATKLISKTLSGTLHVQCVYK